MLRSEEDIINLRNRKDAAHCFKGQDKQHEKGKLTAWERINLLVDEGSFVETNMLIEHRCNYFGMDSKRHEGDGVITGIGSIDGRTVCVFAQDFTVLGGSISETNAKKIVDLQQKAMQLQVPIIGLIDSSGARIQEGIQSLSGHGHIFYNNVQASGKIPQISAIMGSCAGGASYSPALTDFIIMVNKEASMFITGPKVVQEAIGEVISMEALGGAHVHATISGMADVVVSNDSECIQSIKKLLSYLPDNYQSAPKVDSVFGFDEAIKSNIEKYFPKTKRRSFDVHRIIETIVDTDSGYEIKPDYAANIITMLAKIGGHTIGIVANQSSKLAGCIDIDAADKAARFIRLCDSFNIPILTLVDVPGFLPGSDQEHRGIIRHGAKMLYAYAESRVLKVTVVIRKGYGGAFLAMCSKELGADFVLAWPDVELAVMGAEAAIDVLFRKETPQERSKRYDEYCERFLNPDEALHMGYVDDLIEPEHTRDVVLKILETTETCFKYKASKREFHGNIPL